MKRLKKKFLIGALLLLTSGFLVCIEGCAGEVLAQTASGVAMGTYVNQTIYTRDEALTGEVEELLLHLEEDMLSWRIAGSEIARINEAAGEECSISDELKQDLISLLEVSERSNGAFDCTLGTLIRLWNMDAWSRAEEEGFIPPTKEEITEALIDAGYDKIKITGDTIYLPSGIQLDLGAAGKGIACDRVAAFLAGKQVSGAVISVGGSVVTYGAKPDGSPWRVAVVDPLNPSSRLGILTLSGEWYISTSGGYERFVEADGIRYHHILDPATGYPADSGLAGVTIICHSGLLSDALSTACFVLGVEDGLALAESYGAQALFVTTDGQLYMTSGMEELFSSTSKP